ncbi:hypothetical protein [Aureliella helgolandensis]|uniref:Core-binding (CB) domain-containing protein n=1 Tax=Aureliella helgolandensis TaxID=2527968 RepID=A0A518G871_9BACT|nr:hypothetical protein [Aureliella helgolandensis]QDV24782.1 hypothetical protein Q31a_31040 [Aureliella helgolandensis]
MRVPSYRRHSSGNARVTINGKDYLLGKYGSKSSKLKYQRLIAEYRASRKSRAFGKSEPLLQDIMLAFMRYAKEYYAGTTQPYRFKIALKPVAELYATVPANQFGPRQFKVIRDGWLKGPVRSRKYINEQMSLVARMVKWAVAEELVLPEQWAKIQAVEPLERGRTTAPDNEPVEAVAVELIDAN